MVEQHEFAMVCADFVFVQVSFTVTIMVPSVKEIPPNMSLTTNPRIRMQSRGYPYWLSV